LVARGRGHYGLPSGDVEARRSAAREGRLEVDAEAPASTPQRVQVLLVLGGAIGGDRGGLAVDPLGGRGGAIGGRGGEVRELAERLLLALLELPAFGVEAGLLFGQGGAGVRELGLDGRIAGGAGDGLGAEAEGPGDGSDEG
jgi:hypothetical protein